VDLDAKRSGIRAHVTAGLNRWPQATTAYTISLGTPDVMAEATRKVAERPILKIKLGAPEGDLERIRAVRAAAPNATLIADANEGWTEANLAQHFAACAEAGFALVEQPLPAKADAFLGTLPRPVPICADESVHDRPSLDRLVGLYDAVNIKLDKTGGLTEALALAEAAEARGLSLMIGCMVGTSLAMAPAWCSRPRRASSISTARSLAKDREPGLAYEGSVVHPPAPALWGAEAGAGSGRSVRRPRSAFPATPAPPRTRRRGRSPERRHAAKTSGLQVAVDRAAQDRGRGLAERRVEAKSPARGPARPRGAKAASAAMPPRWVARRSAVQDWSPKVTAARSSAIGAKRTTTAAGAQHDQPERRARPPDRLAEAVEDPISATTPIAQR
jgi:hypothetical protein